MDSSGENRPYFFVHIMKVGGGSFKQMVRERIFPGVAFYPGPQDEPPLEANLSPDLLASLTPERRAQIRFYSGHFPLAARSLITPAPRVLTLFRHPVDRAISYLKMHRRDRALQAPLEAIYDDPVQFHGFISNHQVKVLSAATLDELPRSFARRDQDQTDLALAKAAVETLEFFGVQERFQDSLRRCEAMFGWDLGEPARRNLGDDSTATRALRSRIESDNALDMDFYEHVRSEFDARG